MNSTPITIVGNIGGDPEMRYTPTGQAVTAFSVAVTQRKYDKQAAQWKETGTTWYRVIAWGFLAENVAESLARGNRVVVTGTLAARQWKDREDNDRETWEITADAIGPDLTFASVRITRTRRDQAPHPADTAEPAPGPQEPASEPGAPAPAGNGGEPASGPQEPAGKTRRS